MKRGASYSPNDDNEDSDAKSPSATEHRRRAPCKNPKGIAHYTKEVSRFFLLLSLLLLRSHCLDTIFGTHPSRRPRLHVLAKNCGAALPTACASTSTALTTEYKTEQETDSERGKDRLRRVLADVLLAVVLKTADTIECIIQYFFPALPIFIGHCACGRAEIFGHFARVRPGTLCFLSRLRRNRRALPCLVLVIHRIPLSPLFVKLSVPMLR